MTRAAGPPERMPAATPADAPALRRADPEPAPDENLTPIWPRGVVAWALACILAIAVVGNWRPESTAAATRPSHARATAWMAEAIPGVGPKTAAQTADAIRAWQLDDLPPAIGEQVRVFFHGPDEAASPPERR